MFPVNFERCTDHNAFYDEISDELGTAGTDVTWIDRTYLQLTDPGQPPGSNNPVHEVNSNHLTIVNFLNQSAIVKLAKSPH